MTDYLDIDTFDMPCAAANAIEDLVHERELLHIRIKNLAGRGVAQRKIIRAQQEGFAAQDGPMNTMEEINALVKANNTIMFSMPTVTIKFMRAYSEYRVPGADGREEAAYYTDDLDDAIGTARLMHGPSVAFRIRRVSE